MDKIEEDVLDKLTKVCICKAISKEKIKDAIKNGAVTVDEIKEKTGAATGCCKGRRCIEKIQRLIDENTK